jgi:hypothetical protein
LATVLVVLAATTAGTASAADTFSIAGEVDGLYPGFDGVLNATVTNSLDVAIHVQRVDTTVTSVDATGCSAAFFGVDPATTSLDLAPGKSGVVPLTVHMDAAAPDACQGATFALTFQGTSSAQDRAANPSAPIALAFTGTRTDVLAMTGITLLVIGILFVRRSRFQANR